jgi:hypothetical protein
MSAFEPYRPPTAVEPALLERPYVSLSGRAARTGKLLMAFVAVASLNAAEDLFDALVLSGAAGGLSTEAAEAIDLRQGIVLLAYSVCFLATAIPFARVLMQANRNAVALGRASQRFSPASMVWWFFVPILSWVRPLQAVTEAWNAALPRDTVGTPTLVSNWWGLWVIGTIVGGFASRASDKVDTPQGLATALVVDAVVCGVMIAAAFAAKKMLHGLAAVQDEAFVNRPS